MLETKDKDFKDSDSEIWIEVPEDVKKKFLCIRETEGELIKVRESKVSVCITPNGMVIRKIIYEGNVITDTFDPIGLNDGIDIVRFLATVDATKERASEILQDISRRIGLILN